ncbi:hypothetical protein PSCICL_45810 [Pseudomonas cichorii]|nr:hypothetical protein PSCICL_45810 [Pseudomonas cichorii]
MQSSDYVPGVSGWKMFKEGRLEVDGAVRVDLGKAAEENPQPKPFIVVDGVTYISEAEVERQTIAKLELVQGWSVKTALLDVRYVVTGMGIGLRSQVSADQFATDAESVADVVRKVLREELRPGGLLHRNA